MKTPAEMRELALNPESHYDREMQVGWRIAAEICERLDAQVELLGEIVAQQKILVDALSAPVEVPVHAVKR